MPTRRQGRATPKPPRKAVRHARRAAPPAITPSPPRNEPPTPPHRATLRDPRLPPPGTVLTKRARHGATSCECTIEPDGIQYNGQLYRSLSAAAMAAATDLGIKGTQNGFVFWGLSKPARSTDDPVARLERIWTRYESSARAALAARQGAAEGLRDALERHRERAADLA